MTGGPELTGIQRHHVELARKTAHASAADLAGPDMDPEDLAMIYAHAFAWTRGTVDSLLAIIDELTGGAS